MSPIQIGRRLDHWTRLTPLAAKVTRIMNTDYLDSPAAHEHSEARYECGEMLAAFQTYGRISATYADTPQAGYSRAQLGRGLDRWTPLHDSAAEARAS
jgi:hypothetical protein